MTANRRQVLRSAALLPLAAAAWTFDGGTARAIDLAGRVERLQGSAIAVGSTGFSRPLQPGSTILVGDRVETGADSRLRLRMNDGAVMTLGSSSVVTIETYDEDEAAGKALLDVIQGVFLAASGAIARLGPESFQIRTPVAVLGVRGTELWGDALPDRLAVAMLSGTGVIVTTAVGTVELTQPEQGVDVFAGQPLPQPRTWSPERLERARVQVAFE